MGNEKKDDAEDSDYGDTAFELGYHDYDDDDVLASKKGGRGGSKKQQKTRERHNSLKTSTDRVVPLPPKQESIEKTSGYKTKEVLERRSSITTTNTNATRDVSPSNGNEIDNELSDLFKEAMKIYSPVDEKVENGVNINLKPIRYFGWFFGETANESLKKFCNDTLTDCLENKQFRQWFELNCTKHGVHGDPMSYYQPPNSSSFHVTAKFCGGLSQCLAYYENVKDLVGKEDDVAIVGLYFTERTWGLRVKLTQQQEPLFDEERRIPLGRRMSSTSSSEDAQVASPDEEQHAMEVPAQAPPVLTRRHSKNALPLKNYPGLRFIPQRQSFHPTKSRAHVTVGCIPKTKAVTCGEELLDIIDLENRASSPHHDFHVHAGTLRQFGRHGDHVFVLYFNNRIFINSIFMPHD